jgi:hypothetical protein
MLLAITQCADTEQVTVEKKNSATNLLLLSFACMQVL